MDSHSVDSYIGSMSRLLRLLQAAPWAQLFREIPAIVYAAGY
jgi:hypothetical protein